MATKSVIEIDVLDDKFKAFADAFAKYQEALKKMPGDWQRVNTAATAGSANVAKNIAQATKNQKDLNKAVGDSSFGFRNAARITGDIAKNLASGALSIAKWISFGAIGGGFGLGGLAASASDVRRQAQGLGITTGQLRAANVNFGKYIDPQATLANIAELQSSLSQRQIITRLGGQQSQNPADMLATVMRSAVAQFKQGGQTKEYAEAMGLTQVFSMEELRRLASLSEKEFNETIQKFKRDRELLAVDDASSRAWQEFWIQLKRSGNLLETSFIKNLSVLTPQLTLLSDSLAKAIDGFLGSEEVKQKLEDLAKYIGSEEFKQAAGDFMEGLKDLAAAIAWVISSIPNFSRGFKIMGEKIFGEKEQNITAVEGRNENKIVVGLMKLGIKNPEALAGFMGSLKGESATYNPQDVNPTSGATGIAQWLGTRKTELEAFTGKKANQTNIDEQIAFMQYELQNKEKNTLKQLIAAKSKEEGVRANIGYERYDTNMSQAQKDAEFNRRLSYANQIRVDVSSTAGSDITASAKGLPQR